MLGLEVLGRWSSGRPGRRCMDVLKENNDLEGTAERRSSHWYQGFIRLDQGSNWLFICILPKRGMIEAYVNRKNSTNIVKLVFLLVKCPSKEKHPSSGFFAECALKYIIQH